MDSGWQHVWPDCYAGLKRIAIFELWNSQKVRGGHLLEQFIMSMQEVPQPELQPLSMEAKSATAVLKYLQLQAPLLPPMTKTLQEAAQVDMWATRGAALAYTQVCAAISSSMTELM